MGSSVSKQKQSTRPNSANLPPEILLQILCHVKKSELMGKYARLSRQFYHLVHDPILHQNFQFEPNSYDYIVQHGRHFRHYSSDSWNQKQARALENSSRNLQVLKVKEIFFCALSLGYIIVSPKLEELHLTTARNAIILDLVYHNGRIMNKMINKVGLAGVKSIRIVAEEEEEEAESDEPTEQEEIKELGRCFSVYTNLQILDISECINQKLIHSIGNISDLKQLTQLKVNVGNLNGIERCLWNKLESFSIAVTDRINNDQFSMLLSAAPITDDIALNQLDPNQPTDWLKHLNRPFPSIQKMSLSFWEDDFLKDPKLSQIFPNVNECDFTKIKCPLKSKFPKYVTLSFRTKN